MTQTFTRNRSKIARAGWALLILVSAACAKPPKDAPLQAEAAPSAEARPAEAAAPTPLVIRSDALVGCRAPSEPGCATCCEPSDGTFCAQRHPLAMAGYDRYEGALYTPKTRCPAGCKPCAKCTREDEDRLRALPQRPECDCNQPPVVDSCFEPDSCACWCDKRKDVISACPPP